MGCFQVSYDSRVVIYERKLLIRLATGVTDTPQTASPIAKLHMFLVS